MVDLCEQTLLQLDVIYLLQIDNLCLLECLEGDWLAIEQRQVHLAKRASPNDSQQVIISNLALVVLYSASCQCTLRHRRVTHRRLRHGVSSRNVDLLVISFNHRVCFLYQSFARLLMCRRDAACVCLAQS